MRDFLQLVGFILGIAATAAGLIWLGALLGESKCERQWEGSRMEAKYRVLQGCLIKLPDGRWIPAANYREL